MRAWWAAKGPIYTYIPLAGIPNMPRCAHRVTGAGRKSFCPSTERRRRDDDGQWLSIVLPVGVKAPMYRGRVHHDPYRTCIRISSFKGTGVTGGG